MAQFIPFGSIGQFRDAVHTVKSIVSFRGFNESGDPIVNTSIPAPTLSCVATEKIHGTNAAVCFTEKHGFWVQSRNNILHDGFDNAECYKYAKKHEDAWLGIIKKLAKAYAIDLNDKIISVFYEWSGGNIQTKSALSGVCKSSMIFQHFKVTNHETNETSWHETLFDNTWVDAPESDIWNIMKFPYYLIDVDFDNLKATHEYLNKLVTETIEPNSPVGRQFSIDGNVGEGIVVTCNLKTHNGDVQFIRFKVKGSEHTVTKVKKLKTVDHDKDKKIVDFVNYAVNAQRLEQAWQTVYGINNEKKEPSMKSLGEFLRAVVSDIKKEESDVLEASNLTLKDINGKAAQVAKKWYIEFLNT